MSKRIDRRHKPIEQPYVSETTSSTSVGCVTLDAEMARRHGWSEKQINRAAQFVHAVARRENRISHRRGPVPKCPCVTCDRKVPLEQLQGLGRIPKWRREGRSS